MKCPKCDSLIQKEKINVHTDVAQCSKCDHVFRISENLENYIDDDFSLHDTPDGTWYKSNFNGTTIGATTRSPVAFFLVPFMIIWSGGSVGAIYGGQLISGEFDLTQSLFGIPFLLGSIFFWTFALMSIWGKVELTLNSKGGKVFTGIGNIGLVKRFMWEDIRTIKEKKSNLSYPGSQRGNLVFEGKNRISFGLGVKEERRYYLFRAIKSLIHNNRWV